MIYAPLYIAARTVLLDALETLGAQRDAVVVVGGQAVYMRTGESGVAVSPYTTDADLALDPALLANEPHIEELMHSGNFFQKGRNPGEWIKTINVGDQPVDMPVDIMVPTGFAPASNRRSVSLPPHDKMIARTTPGLEGTIVDNDTMTVAAFHGTDTRSFVVRIAGPAALLVAKAHKLADRVGGPKAERIDDKDAADVYRLMLTIPVEVVAARMQGLLADEIAGPPSREGLEELTALFGARGAVGVQMAVNALRVSEPSDRIAAVCTSFVRQMRDVLAGSTPAGSETTESG